jgi:hypothetical protein
MLDIGRVDADAGGDRSYAEFEPLRAAIGEDELVLDHRARLPFHTVAQHAEQLCAIVPGYASTMGLPISADASWRPRRAAAGLTDT